MRPGPVHDPPTLTGRHARMHLDLLYCFIRRPHPKHFYLRPLRSLVFPSMHDGFFRRRTMISDISMHEISIMLVFFFLDRFKYREKVLSRRRRRPSRGRPAGRLWKFKARADPAARDSRGPPVVANVIILDIISLSSWLSSLVLVLAIIPCSHPVYHPLLSSWLSSFLIMLSSLT